MCKISSIPPKVTEGFLCPRVLFFKVMYMPIPLKNLATWYMVKVLINNPWYALLILNTNMKISCHLVSRVLVQEDINLLQD